MSGENHDLNLSDDLLSDLKDLQGQNSGQGGNPNPNPNPTPNPDPNSNPNPNPQPEGGGNDADADSAEDGDYFEDEAGNIIDSTGKVVVNKADIKRDAEGNVILPGGEDDAEVVRIQKALEAELGVNFTDDDGKPLAFDNTDDGVVTMVKTAAQRLQEQFEADLFETYPEAANLIRHMKAGKPIDTFFNVSTQWRKTVIPTDTDKNRESNKALRQNILLEKEFLIRTGGNASQFSKEELAKIQRESRDYVDYVMATGGDVEKANDALQYLRGWEDKIEKERDETNRAILQKEQETAQKFWTNVQQIVSSGNLGLVGIPKAERDAFYNYIAKPVTKDGRTQEEVDFENDDIKNRVFLSYLRFKKFNLDDVLKARILNEQAKQLEGRKHKKVSVKFGEQVQAVKKINSLDGININTITNS